MIYQGEGMQQISDPSMAHEFFLTKGDLFMIQELPMQRK